MTEAKKEVEGKQRTWAMRMNVAALEFLHHAANVQSVQDRRNYSVADLVKQSLVKTYGDELAKLLQGERP